MRWLLALWLAIAPACAQEAVIGSGVSGGVKAAATYTGPGDVVSGATAWYGLRAYSAAVAGSAQNAVTLRNTGSNETCNFTTTTSGGLSTASGCSGASTGSSLATFCTGGCAVTKLYDQTAGSHCASASCDLAQATAADQPTLTVSCFNSLPCYSLGAAAISVASANNFTPANGAWSAEIIHNRSAGTGAATLLSENNNVENRITGGNGVANVVRLMGGSSGGFNATAADATWHAIPFVQNGASPNSIVNVDGTETTGSTTGNTTAGKPSIVGAASTTIEGTEAGFWDNVTFTSGQRTSMCRNQQVYYGAGNFGATC